MKSWVTEKLKKKKHSKIKYKPQTLCEVKKTNFRDVIDKQANEYKLVIEEHKLFRDKQKFAKFIIPVIKSTKRN